MLPDRLGRRGYARRRDRPLQFPAGEITRTLMNDYTAAVQPSWRSRRSDLQGRHRPRDTGLIAEPADGSPVRLVISSIELTAASIRGSLGCRHMPEVRGGGIDMEALLSYHHSAR